MNELLIETLETVYLVVDSEQKLAEEEELLVETMEEEELLVETMAAEEVVVEPLMATVSAY